MELPRPPPFSSSEVPHQLGWVQSVGGFHRLHHLVPVILHSANLVTAVVVILIKCYSADAVLLYELSHSYFTLFWCFTLQAFVTHVLFASVFYAWAWNYPEPQEISKRRCTYGCMIDLVFGDLFMFALETKMVYEIQFKSPSLGVAYCFCCLNFSYTCLRVWIFIVQLFAKLNFLYEVKRSHPPYRPDDIRDSASLSFAYRFYNMPKEHFPAPQLTDGVFEVEESSEESENEREEDESESDGQRSSRNSSSLDTSQLTVPFERKKGKKTTSKQKKEQKRKKEEVKEKNRRATVAMEENGMEDHYLPPLSSSSADEDHNDAEEEKNVEEDSDRFPSTYARCATREEFGRNAQNDGSPPSVSSSTRFGSPLEKRQSAIGMSGDGKSSSDVEKKNRESDVVGEESSPDVDTRRRKMGEWNGGRGGEPEEGGLSLPITETPWRPLPYRSESVEVQWRNDITMPVRERRITPGFKYGSYRGKN